ncbi:FTR1 family iron permease [Phototrophicus methaneseepsis]|uniref:FTR1 family iron permease n=1 Tax=Phototrophicus methaneseepsis TaxID=2710758 RepID=A0A7S8ECJ4_9CHLR|nr:FTR1 family protein [Phototrophicus methaneseepsis]QPC84470.1 FTR1 family iron permease [Phototrophicus methaneseepsis]
MSVGQATPIWQSGDTLRSTLFDIQRLFITARRADDPDSVYAQGQGLLEQAAATYTDQFQPEVASFAPAADEAITTALNDAQLALDAGDQVAFAAARGRIWTNLLWASYDVVAASLADGDIAAAQAWLALREYRQATSVTLVDSPAARALRSADEGDLTFDEAGVIVGNDLRDAYYFRLRDALTELEAAIGDQYAMRAAEWAGQAQGYFHILQSDYAAKLGEDEAVTIASTLAHLEADIMAQDWDAVAAGLQTVRTSLANYQPVELSAELIAERGRLFHLFLDLVYVEYKDAVRNGEITIPIEYQETTTFYAQAASIYEELRPTISASDPAAAERLDAILADIDAVIADLGDPAQVQIAVSEGLSLIETTLQVDASSGDSAAMFTVIDTLLDDLLAAAAEGRYEEAERTRVEAYGLFESGPELRLANRAPVLSRELEGLFWEGSSGQAGLYTLLDQEADDAALAVAVGQVRQKLNEAESFLGGGLSSSLAAINSATIIIREGLEAVLIIGAILGYMFKMDAERRYIMQVLIGVLAAVALSVATWFAAETFLTITPVQRELIEGVTSLLAVAVLFYVTNWLFHKAYVVDWMTFVREQADKALSNGGAFGLAALGFTVVYREGLETVLFYQALMFDAEPLPVVAGFIVGLGLILAIAYAILRLSKRLPLKPLFTITTIVLLVLAFSFTGAGVRELQEASVISATLLPWFPENLLLMELFGLFPTLETLVAQVIFTVLIALTFTYSRWQGSRGTAAVQRASTT